MCPEWKTEHLAPFKSLQQGEQKVKSIKMEQKV